METKVRSWPLVKLAELLADHPLEEAQAFADGMFAGFALADAQNEILWKFYSEKYVDCFFSSLWINRDIFSQIPSMFTEGLSSDEMIQRAYER
jgi:hypothetical protein